MGHWTPWIKLHHITEILHLPEQEPAPSWCVYMSKVCASTYSSVWACNFVRGCKCVVMHSQPWIVVCVFTRGVVSGLTVPSQYAVCVWSLSAGVLIDRRHPTPCREDIVICESLISLRHTNIEHVRTVLDVKEGNLSSFSSKWEGFFLLWTFWFSSCVWFVSVCVLLD